MYNLNTLVPADNTTFISLNSEQDGWRSAYPYDMFSKSGIPIIKSLNISDTIFSPNGEQDGWRSAYPYDMFSKSGIPIIKPVLPKNGYVIDDNSTSALKPRDNNDIWISKKSTQLLSLLCTEDIESGISNPSEVFVKHTLEENKALTLQMINQVYVDNVGSAHVQIGILHLISHIDYSIGYPTLQTIAIAALSDSNDDVKDYAVQCYENWNHEDGLRILKTIHTDTQWLQNYIDSVITSLSESFPEVVTA